MICFLNDLTSQIKRWKYVGVGCFHFAFLLNLKNSKHTHTYKHTHLQTYIFQLCLQFLYPQIYYLIILAKYPSPPQHLLHISLHTFSRRSPTIPSPYIPYQVNTNSLFLAMIILILIIVFLCKWKINKKSLSPFETKKICIILLLS